MTSFEDGAMTSPPEGLQLDLLTVVSRLQQIADDGGFYDGGPVEIVAERLLTCDLPRLRDHLAPRDAGVGIETSGGAL